MTKSAKYSINKSAINMQPKDRFYLSGKKYVVTAKPVKDMFGRVIITFIRVDGSPTEFCDLSVPVNFPFMVLTGESGIGETAYDELQKMLADDKAKLTVVPEKKQVLDIVLATKSDIESVLGYLRQAIENYGAVSVGDLYESVGLTGTFEDTKWGWSLLSGAGFMETDEGYKLVLPKPVLVEGLMNA